MPGFFIDLRHRNSTLYYFGWINLVGVLACIIMTQVNDVQLLGVNAWIKPVKFFLSTTIFSWTMGWLLHYLKEPRKTTIYSWMVVAVLSFENLYILVRASRGEMSHFNISSGFNATMFSLMGMAITVMTIWTGYFAYLFMARDFPEIKKHYLWGIRFGLLFFVIFALGGHVMASMLGHTVGAKDGGEGLPFVNWSRKHGDLRVAHFMGMHSLQVLPLIGYYISRRSIITVILSIVYFLLVTAVFIQALISKPLIQFYQG
jgi:hypothetical protein